MIDGPRGRRALIHFRPQVDAHHARFEVYYAVVTPVHDEFLSDRGVPTSPWQSTTAALLETRLLAPGSVQTGVPVPGFIFPWFWVLGTDDDHNARVGAALANGLVSGVLPGIASCRRPRGSSLEQKE